MSRVNRSTIPFALATLVVALTTGCAARRAYEYRSKQVEAFIYPMPIDQVLDGVRKVLFTRGFTTEPAGSHSLRTDWRYTYRQTTAEGRHEPVEEAALMHRTNIYEDYQRFRYLVQAEPTDAGHTRLVVTQDEERSIEGTVTRWPYRDLDLEWEILERLMPDEAARIRAEAKAAAEKG